MPAFFPRRSTIPFSQDPVGIRLTDPAYVQLSLSLSFLHKGCATSSPAIRLRRSRAYVLSERDNGTSGDGVNDGRSELLTMKRHADRDPRFRLSPSRRLSQRDNGTYSQKGYPASNRARPSPIS